MCACRRKRFKCINKKSGFYDDCMKVTPSRSLKCFVAFSICSMLSVKTLINEATYLFLWLLLRISSPSLRGPSSRYRVESSQSDPALLGWAWVCRWNTPPPHSTAHVLQWVLKRNRYTSTQLRAFPFQIIIIIIFFFLQNVNNFTWCSYSKVKKKDPATVSISTKAYPKRKSRKIQLFAKGHETFIEYTKVAWDIFQTSSYG